MYIKSRTKTWNSSYLGMHQLYGFYGLPVVLVDYIDYWATYVIMYFINALSNTRYVMLILWYTALHISYLLGFVCHNFSVELITFKACFITINYHC